MHGLNEAVIQDGFSPPVAARIYSYCNLAAYEAQSSGTGTMGKYREILNGYNPSFPSVDLKEINSDYVTYQAFCDVAREVVYRDFIIDTLYKTTSEIYFADLPEPVVQKSKELGKKIAEQILAYSAGDNYKELRSAPFYELKNRPDTWVPTPPFYATALEPYWGEMRPFVIKDVKEFFLPNPVPFDSAKGSEFYKMAYRVYEMGGEDQDSSFMKIAWYWDGDPAPPKRVKRIAITKRQLNPIGHWLAIAEQLCERNKVDNYRSTEILMKLSIGNCDDLIACWYNKYATNLIRPHSYILKYIDPNWDPLLITPNFPEYPSGHSTIAGVSSGILIKEFSDTISFWDSSQVKFGFEARYYHSLSEAANECAASRAYGGVHFEPATKEGVKMGRKVAELHLDKMNQQPNTLANRITLFGKKIAAVVSSVVFAFG